MGKINKLTEKQLANLAKGRLIHKFRRMRPDEIAKARELKKQKLKLREIVDQIGFSTTTIHNVTKDIRGFSYWKD